VAEGQESAAEPILRDALASARAAPFALLPWQVAEAESALSVCLTAQHRNAEAEPLARQSRAGLQQHPRPVFREHAGARLAALNLQAHQKGR